MSFGALINDYERGDCAQQTSTGTSAGDATPTRQRRIVPAAVVEHDTNEGNTRGRRQRTPPTVESNTSGGNTRFRIRRTPTIADGTPVPDAESTVPTRPRKSTKSRKRPATADEELGTDAENTVLTRPRKSTKSRKRPATADGEPGTYAENTVPTRPKKSTKSKKIPATADGEPGTDADSTVPTRPKKSTRPKKRAKNTMLIGTRRKRVFERDLTPAERAIPDTTLLNNLGYHLSAYARAGRGPPTQNLYCRGAWCNAVTLYRKANNQYKELFIAAGFGDFLSIEPVEVPIAYSLALLERWFGQTNTLHLPSCEIGPTPVDWTMVTGVPFGGRSIGVESISMERALELLGVGNNAVVDNKIGLSKIIPSEQELKDEPATAEVKEKVFRRLFLYVVSSCFFNNNRSVISHKLVECLERIDRVREYDWGAMTFAAFLSGMRRKVTAEIGALTAFWQFLPFWAFEYLDINRPKDPADNVFPMANRWICSNRLISDNDSSQFFSPNFIGSRCQLACVEESQVTWQPYMASSEYCSRSMKSTINLAKKRVAFQSIDTWEYYLGERCLRQFGFPCRVPYDPPQIMHGICEGQDDEIWNRISAKNLVHQSLDYSSWFGTASVGRILNVNPYIGGLGTARKVLDNWRAKHRPDLILISRSEYKKLKEDRDAAKEKLAKVRQEMSQS